MAPLLACREGEPMMFLAIVGGVIVLAILLGVLADRRAKRRGKRFGNWNREAINNRLDIEAAQRGGPAVQGQSQEWMTFRRRDQKPGK
jgi:hypothetical protein